MSEPADSQHASNLKRISAVLGALYGTLIVLGGVALVFRPGGSEMLGLTLLGVGSLGLLALSVAAAAASLARR
jgi:hypothetical protein